MSDSEALILEYQHITKYVQWTRDREGKALVIVNALLIALVMLLVWL